MNDEVEALHNVVAAVSTLKDAYASTNNGRAADHIVNALNELSLAICQLGKSSTDVCGAYQ